MIKEMKKKKSTSEGRPVVYEIKKPEIHVMRLSVSIEGDRLLVDRLNPEALQGYGNIAEERPTGELKDAAPLTIQEIFERAKYRDYEGRDAFPANGVRGCIRDAAVEFDRKEASKAGFNRAVIMRGDMLPLSFEECRIDDRMGRNSGQNRSPRRVIRALYLDWSLSFEIDLSLDSMNPTQLYRLIEVGGQRIGIGNWRPGTARGGSFGRFTVTDFKEVKMDPPKSLKVASR